MEVFNGTIKDILIAVIGSISTIIVAYFGYLATSSKKKKETAVSKKELDLSKLKSFKQISVINNEVNELFARTTADRFLILLCEEEKNIKYVTAIYELHKYSQENANMVYGLVNKYVKLKLDSEYESMLREIKEKGLKKYDTATMKDSMLKNFYQYENVEHSNIYFLIEFDNGDILFFSIAKHKDVPYNVNEETLFSLAASKIIQIIENSEFDEED